MKNISKKTQILMTALGIVAFPLSNISSVYASPTGISQQTTTDQQQVSSNKGDGNAEKPKEPIKTHTAVTYHATQGEQKPNAIVADNKSGIKDNEEEARLRDQLLKELRAAHAKGKYKDVTEDMIMNLTGRELRNLMLNEYLGNKKTWNTAKDSILNTVDDENKPGEPLSDMDYTDLYSYPKDVQKSIFSTIKDYAAEKKETAAILALGAGGSLVFLKKGRELLASETSEEAEARHQKMYDIENTPMSADELLKRSQGKIDFDGDYYTDIVKPQFSREDNLRNLTEMYTASGITLKQEKDIADNMNRATGKTSKQLSKAYKEEIADMHKDPTFEGCTDEDLENALRQGFEIGYGNGGGEFVDAAKSGTSPKVHANQNIGERLSEINKAIGATVFGELAKDIPPNIGK